MLHILIVIPTMAYGGTTRSLANLMSFFRLNDQYDISILAMDVRGGYSNKFSGYQLLKEDLTLLGLVTFRNYGYKESIIHFVVRLYQKLFFKFVLRGNISKLLTRSAKKYSGRYDVVISFQEGLCTRFVSNIQSKKRIAWIRCEYSSYYNKNGGVNELPFYSKYNNVVCNSKSSAESFCLIYPVLSSRVSVVYNFIDYKGIIRDSNEKVDLSFDRSKFLIVSVGRLDPIKRFDMIPKIASELKNNHIDFIWYIIGDGVELKKISEETDRLNLKREVILLGSRNNPYPYIKKCDLLVCLSVSESCPNVINEAKILHTPILSTDFSSAKEYIVNGCNGYIVPLSKISSNIIMLAQTPQKYSELKRKASVFKYDNDSIANEICRLMG